MILTSEQCSNSKPSPEAKETVDTGSKHVPHATFLGKCWLEPHTGHGGFPEGSLTQ